MPYRHIRDPREYSLQVAMGLTSHSSDVLRNHAGARDMYVLSRAMSR